MIVISLNGYPISFTVILNDYCPPINDRKGNNRKRRESVEISGFEPLAYPEICQHIPVDIQTGTGCGGGTDGSVSIQRNGILKCFIYLCVVLRRIEFCHDCIGNGTIQMDMYLLLAVGTQNQTVGISHGGNLHKFCDTAQALSVGIQEGNGLGVDEIPVAGSSRFHRRPEGWWTWQLSCGSRRNRPAPRAPRTK